MVTIKCFTSVGLLDIACCAAITCVTDHFLLPCFPPATCDTACVSAWFSTQHFYMEDRYFKYFLSAYKPVPCLPLGSPTTEANDSQQSRVSPIQYEPGPALGEQNQRRNAQIRPFLCTQGTSLEPCSGSAAPGWITTPGCSSLLLIVVWDRHGRKKAPF